jgi:MFS family permease
MGALNFAANFSAGGMVLTTLALLVQQRHVSLLSLPEKSTAGLLMGWMVIAEALATIASGHVGDRFGAHPQIATLGIVLFVPGLVITALAATPLGLLAGLAVIGAAAAALGPPLLALLGEKVERDRQGALIGALQLLGDLGGALGPLVGTAWFAADARAAYLSAAALSACFVPFARWLRR